MMLKASLGTDITPFFLLFKCARERTVNVLNRNILQVTVCKKLRGSKEINTKRHLKYPLSHHDRK